MPKMIKQAARPCPEGYRRLDVPTLNEQRWEALFDFLIEQNEPEPKTLNDLITGPKRTVYKLVNGTNGFRIDESDYEWFRNFNPERDFEWEIETNADDDTIIWFRMKYL